MFNLFIPLFKDIFYVFKNSRMLCFTGYSEQWTNKSSLAYSRGLLTITEFYPCQSKYISIHFTAYKKTLIYYEMSIGLEIK